MRLIIFDCDGTLIDSQHAIISAVTKSFIEQKLPTPSPREIRTIIGLSVPKMMERLHSFGTDAEKLDLIRACRHHFFQQNSLLNGIYPMFPYTLSTLRQLRAAGYILGVATGMSDQGLNAVITNNNLDNLFSTRQTADRHPSKPDPSMLLQAMAEVDVEAKDTLMLGDTSLDMVMAVAAGVTPIGVSWGNHDVDSLYDAGAETVLEDIRGLLPYLDQKNRGL